MGGSSSNILCKKSSSFKLNMKDSVKFVQICTLYKFVHFKSVQICTVTRQVYEFVYFEATVQNLYTRKLYKFAWINSVSLR